jgi:ankyrin repeat-rich membrane spanning protein
MQASVYFAPSSLTNKNKIWKQVEMLLEKKAKISAADLKGDTALHIAMRARSQ